MLYAIVLFALVLPVALLRPPAAVSSKTAPEEFEPGAVAEPLVTAFAEALRGLGAHVQTGVFGANMQVELVNDGPVTVILEL